MIRPLHPAIAMILSAAFAAGCTRSLAGDWYGTCAFSDESYGYSGSLAISVVDGGGQRISGRVELDMSDDRELKGDMTGLRSDAFVEMEAVLAGPDGPFLFELEGDLEDDGSIDGTCRLKLDEGGAGLVGDVVLEQP